MEWGTIVSFQQFRANMDAKLLAGMAFGELSVPYERHSTDVQWNFKRLAEPSLNVERRLLFGKMVSA